MTCHRIGHTRVSQNCPIRLHVSIIENSNQLEQELLSQASTKLVTFNWLWKIWLEVPDSARTAASQTFTPEIHESPKSPNTGTQLLQSARTMASQVFALLIPLTICKSLNFLNTGLKFLNTEVEISTQPPLHIETLESSLWKFRPPTVLEEIGVAYRGTTPMILEQYSNLAVLPEES